MSQNELVAKIEELNELENLMEQLKTQADGLRDDIKSEMTTRGTEELNLGKYIVRWTSVLSTRFDTKKSPLRNTPTKAERKRLSPQTTMERASTL